MDRAERSRSASEPADVVYGRNPVAEARLGRRRVLREWTAQEVGAERLERLCGSPDHQGVVAEVEPYPYSDPNQLLGDERALVLALDQIQDPGNLGAICRTAEAAGAAGVVICERRAAQITPAVCKASAGAVEHLPVARVRNLADWLISAREQGAWSYGAAADAPTSYRTLDLSGRVILVLGGEGRGLRPRVAESCDGLISIPIVGRVGSLNVSVAAAVLSFAAGRAG
ncbi:MAG: 23S rRNA (guanosine(2251)-2'-O)-methyltransferase RlmB [Thermoleophilia bacterium]|nr:23S rRNA (guanosine(2251)-2'-O)-methyltransferase RlmB [Thermoleophilia bacterium]